MFQDYQYDIDRAVEDAEDYTLEELDFERPEGDLVILQYPHMK